MGASLERPGSGKHRVRTIFPDAADQPLPPRKTVRNRNGVRIIRTPFHCGPFSWEATAGPPHPEKWFGRGSCLSPAIPSDAPISRTDQPRPIIYLIDRVRPRQVTRCYMSLLRGGSGRFFDGGEARGQQKSRINKDPAEFDWKCRLGLTSRGEHSRALMGGERALEMSLYICSSCPRNKHLFCNTRMQKDAGCGPTCSRNP